MERMKHTGDYELDEINMLEQECADLEEENKRLENENIRLKSDIDAMLQNERGYKYDINKLEEENKNLKEFKTKREESMFYFKAQMERAEPKTASEAEDLQKAKKLFEKLYREELSCLEEENKKLKEENEKMRKHIRENGYIDDVAYIKKENKKLKETIKDHQLYEEKLEHRIIEFEELLHGE